MNPHPLPNHRAAVTRLEVLALIISVGMLICFATACATKNRDVSRDVCCNCQLKCIWGSFLVWEGNNEDHSPMAVSTNQGGAMEDFTTGKVFRIFQVISNMLSDPAILVCPQDVRRAATNFTTDLSNSKISYFVGEVTNAESLQLFLSGDRNITGGKLLPNNIFEMVTNRAIGWSKKIHNGIGNLALADGMVKEMDSAELNVSLQETGLTTNRIVLP